MYYIYKIENTINHKKYIGLTNNIERRKARHFTDLKCNRHDNSFLQKEYNIYGKDNFIFSIEFKGDITPEQIEEKEKEYIKFYDSYRNGYNQNEGGRFGPSNGGTKLLWNDILNILSVCEFMSRPGQILSDIYNISKTTVMRIKKGINHDRVYEYYHRMSEKERREIFDIFCDAYDLKYWLAKNHALKSKRIFNKKDIFCIYYEYEELGITMKMISELFNCRPYTIKLILSGKSYTDYYIEYSNMTKEQRKNVLLFGDE